MNLKVAENNAVNTDETGKQIGGITVAKHSNNIASQVFFLNKMKCSDINKCQINTEQN